MSDRTQPAFGRNTMSVPRLTKRMLEALLATGVTALVALVILLLNNVLTARTVERSRTAVCNQWRNCASASLTRLPRRESRDFTNVRWTR